LLNVAPLVRSLDFIDSANLFLYGESRGGMMVLQALREGFPARAAAVFGAFTDLEGLLETDPDRYQPLISKIWPDFSQRKEEILKRRSALSWAESINTPLLLMHGSADGSVPPEQTLRLALRLQELDKSYELIVFDGADHILSQRRNERDRHVLDWFERHRTTRD
ncbi:MAG: prolyl oligopeptidase family serine peptidase, partial [Acidobacteriota bacterium]